MAWYALSDCIMVSRTSSEMVFGSGMSGFFWNFLYSLERAVFASLFRVFFERSLIVGLSVLTLAFFLVGEGVSPGSGIRLEEVLGVISPRPSSIPETALTSWTVGTVLVSNGLSSVSIETTVSLAATGGAVSLSNRSQTSLKKGTSR